MTYSRFMELFPDNAACLDYLKDKFYADGTACPSCGKPSKFHRIRGRSAFACQYCRHQVYPTAGTIFEKSTTSLQLWFWAIYLMSSTRCGISAKQLEREVGVTYKTAHRMFKQIRTLLAEDDDGPTLSGDVEIDETYHGGKPRAQAIRNRTGNIDKTKRAPVLGMVERGGRVRAVLPDTGGPTIKGTIQEHVLPESMIVTDEWPTYHGVDKTYRGHRRIRHKERIYVDGDTHTQSVEGFFGLFKNGVRGVYHAVSREYLQNYLDEYAFRYNARNATRPMFWLILDRVAKPSPVGP